MGQRFFIDAEAARILVGFGKAKYVDKVLTTDNSEALLEPRKRKYQRRDMKARD